ncbi:hypothetical protein D3C76_416310 [compost metagenome]
MSSLPDDPFPGFHFFSPAPAPVAPADRAGSLWFAAQGGRSHGHFPAWGYQGAARGGGGAGGTVVPAPAQRAGSQRRGPLRGALCAADPQRPGASARRGVRHRPGPGRAPGSGQHHGGYADTGQRPGALAPQAAAVGGGNCREYQRQPARPTGRGAPGPRHLPARAGPRRGGLCLCRAGPGAVGGGRAPAASACRGSGTGDQRFEPLPLGGLPGEHAHAPGAGARVERSRGAGAPLSAGNLFHLRYVHAAGR